MKTVLIFGATGTVGVYCALDLKTKGYHVIAVGNRSSDNGFFKDYGIEYYSVDISDYNNFDHLPKNNIDYIIHFAGAMPAHMNGYDGHRYINSIVNGTLNVLEFTRNVNSKRIVFSQSISDILYLFGGLDLIPADAERRFPLTGDHSVYSISKNAAVNLIEHYFYEYGIKRFILRMPTIYAYHPNPYYYVNGQKKWMAFRYIIDRAIKSDTVEIWGDPSQQKEIVYINDFVQIVEKSLKADCDGGIYNVGCGVGVTLEKQVRGIIEVFSPKHKKSDVVYKPDMPNSPQFILDISKTKADLKYEPQYDYLSYLRDFKKEMGKNRFSKLWGVQSDY